MQPLAELGPTFQISRGGESRQDRGPEQKYLRMLARLTRTPLRSNLVCRHSYVKNSSLCVRRLPLLQRRDISTKVAFVRSARAVSIGLVLGITTFAVGIGGMYWYESRFTDESQKIPTEWDVKTRAIVRAAVKHEQGSEPAVAAELYRMAIERLISVPGFNINSKGAVWLHGYADVLIRLGLIESSLGNVADAKEALTAATSLPAGTRGLQVKSYLQLAEYEQDIGQKEELVLQAVKIAGGAEISTLLDNQILEIPSGLNVSDSLAESLVQLARVYSTNGKYQDAFKLLLGTLRGLGDKPADSSNCIRPLIKAYIGELLWALGSQKEALVWTEGSYYESYPTSRSKLECRDCAMIAASLTSKMYGHLGMTDNQRRFMEKHEALLSE